MIGTMLLVALVSGFVSSPALAAQAARIDNITPSCAAVGNKVTITGNGFGGPKVKIAVGGVPAKVVSATGNKATFLISAGVPPGITTVTATNPDSQTGSIGFQVKGPEVCDGVDNDCDGKVDEDLGTLTCGVGACARTVAACVNGRPGQCVPGTPSSEVCGNGVDDDCDGSIDEGFDVGASCTVGVGVCARSGVKACTADGNGTVCNATPGTPTTEVCNGIDDDCNGVVDEGLGTTTCGLGVCQHTVQNCVGGVVQVCDPLQGASREICGNAIDEDCDGVAEPCPSLAITITTPQNLASFNRSPVTVAGTVETTATAVTCNDVAALSGPGAFSASVPLREGNNTLTCVAQDATGHVGTASITVTLDTMPPRITTSSPQEGTTVTASPVTVTGMINDIVVGTVNQQEAQVECNGVTAQIANRAFIVTDVPLTPGSNTITCTGTDKAGNVDSERVHVTLEVPTGPKINLVSGDNQTGPIGARLPAPLVVSLTDNGTPVAGKTVLFRVLRNDGTLNAGSLSGRFLPIVTDANGQAQVDYTLGTWAGAGNNQVQAMATDFAGEVLFSASALPGDAASIVVDAGNNQQGVVSQQLPRPFVAVVIDRGSNRLGGVPVTFTVTQGSGNFGGQSAMTVNTDSDGRVQAVLTLGPDGGFDNNIVSATFPNNPAAVAMFVASGKVAGDPAQTTISGVVLDNTNLPIPGVTLGIEDPTSTTNPKALLLSVQADAQGQFALQPAPVGHVKLIADGSTAQRPGTWPKLEYELVTIAGQNNTIGMPVYLLPLDLPHGVLVDETHGGTLTLPEVPGFSLTILPGSATFPDGSTRGTVSVTVVHPDKVPMVPNFGQQPRFIVTIQPAGTHFNPPAAITIPNADGFAPGQKTEMYSFDHDLGQFVSIGPGTVSDDGLVIASDPGVGVIKGGWHCGGNPSGIGTCEHECDDGNDCTDDFFVNGQCQHLDATDGKLCRSGQPSTIIACGAGVVNLTIDASCNGKCKLGKCEDSPFGIGTMEATAVLAVEKICQTDCIGNDNGLRDKIRDRLRRNGLKVKCADPIPINPGDCAAVPGGCPEQTAVYIAAKTVTPGTSCNMQASLRAYFLHEMVHAYGCQDEFHAVSCATKCFPGEATGGDPVAGCQ